jgi:3-phenylpropionate/trans-cinnamate dioxygenase ferredoxin subunit
MRKGLIGCFPVVRRIDQKITNLREREMERFIEVVNVDEVERRGNVAFVEGLSIAILNADGAFYAIDDSCPFDGASLSDGFLNRSVVECVGDKSRFFVPTGECLSQPEGKHLRSYRVRVDKEDVFVDLRQSLAPRSEKEIETGSQSSGVIRNAGPRSEGFTEALN